MTGLCFFVHSLKDIMKTWIVLLRGVNVSGKNKLPMADFRTALSAVGFSNVQSYIQSGNIIVQAADKLAGMDVSKTVQAVLSDKFNISAPLMVLSPQDFGLAAKMNPFGQDFEAPNWMFLFFLASEPEATDLDKLTELTGKNERWKLVGNVFYAYAGDGAGRSKLMARAEKYLGVSTTAHNWKTAQKIIEMTGAQDGPT